MQASEIQVYDDNRLESVGVRLLTPENTTLFEGSFSLMHCAVKGDTMYRGVYAMVLFPVSHPDRFISLRYTDGDDKEREIGIIDDLKGFPDAVQAMVQESMAKHYFECRISRIHSVENRFGLLFFDVETARGRLEFVMPWRGDRAEDYGPSGKVLLDSFDNRYVIPDLSELPPADRDLLASYIYW
jgi:hypothetical protein